VKVWSISFTEDGMRAHVDLEPNWLARLFGARRVCVDLKRDDERFSSAKGWDKCPWYSLRTDRPLQEIRCGMKILKAMEAQPKELPKAIVFPTRKCNGCGDAVTSSFDWCKCVEIKKS
jgi:hypothetical protein